MLKFIILSLIAILSTSMYAENWPGHAIVGNGKFCAVYSEDSRVTSKDGYIGIRHLYIDDFTTDYIKSAWFRIFNKSAIMQKDSVVPFMADFFTPAAKHYQGKTHVFTTKLRATENGVMMQFIPEVNTEALIVDFVCTQTLDAGYKLVVSPSQSPLEASSKQFLPNTNDNNDYIRFKVKNDRTLEVLIAKELYSPEYVMVSWQHAAINWKKWIKEGNLPYKVARTDSKKLYNEYYSRNLYAAWSSCLNGQVPADVTGQFLTNGMPQLYPRDALMTARNFLQTGYYEEAANIIRYWANPQIPRKTPGEFYARYDAFGKATNAGSGARFDEPEWDASGYFIILNKEYHDLKKKWLTDPRLLFECADFITASIDSTGLLYEGGIVEWTGYLPATNMICAAGLRTAANIAKEFNRPDLSAKYLRAYKIIESSLPKLFDQQRMLYTARRYHGIKADDNFSIMEKKGELLYLWDATAVFGILWGFPDHQEMIATYAYLKENLNDNGGVKYFEATDNGWLEAYGTDLFYFATAAWAKYAMIQHDYEFAKKNLDWIINQSNIYGLLPERVISDYSNISEASPLTWGCAEFAGAVRTFARNAPSL